MTSAVLNRNESSFMRKSPFSNPHLNPNPNPNRQNFSNGGSVQSAAVRKQLPADDGSSLSRNVSLPSGSGQFDQGRYQTLNMGSYTHSEKKQLKKRLKVELDQVRQLTTQIESAEQFCGVGTSTSSQNHLPNWKFPSRKISGMKRSVDNLYGKGAKQAAMGSSKLMKKCGQVLTKLMKHKNGWIFNVPVDVVGMKLHDYYQVVKKPMDLGTIKMNLSKHVYLSPMDFAADVRLTFKNAMLYNPEGHDVHSMAEQLLGIFEQSFRPVCREYELELRRYEQMSYQKGYSDEELPESSWINNNVSRMPDRFTGREPEVLESTGELDTSQIIERPAEVDASVQKPVQVQSPPPASPRIVSPVKPSSKTKLPKPKAKDPNKREMNGDEKLKLGAELQALPDDKMAQLLQIVRKRNHHVIENENEVELDIESLDIETLWELDRFVLNWKKTFSKLKRQELAGNNGSLPSDGEDMVVSDAEVNTVCYGEGGKAKKGDDEDIDIGDEMPVSSFPPVEIEKDDVQDNISKNSSSSGGSSSDSSSSSDSDSGSSSGSESDAEVA